MTRPKTASVRAWGLALVLLVMALAPGRVGADPADEALLFAQLNAARAQSRIAGLARSPELDVIARRHAARIAGAPHPFHNANLRAETAGWLAIGEVVGRVEGGPGWEGRLQQLFLTSPTHRRVTLGTSFTVVGIGTVRTATNVVNAVEVFGRPSGVRPPRPPRAARAASTPVARPPRPAQPAPPPPPPPPPPTTTTTQPLSRLALAPLPGGPPATPSPAPVARAGASRAGPPVPLAFGATAAELAVLGLLTSVVSASGSRRAGRRHPWR
jgi:hypothetical protein